MKTISYREGRVVCTWGSGSQRVSVSLCAHGDRDQGGGGQKTDWVRRENISFKVEMLLRNIETCQQWYIFHVKNMPISLITVTGTV